MIHVRFTSSQTEGKQREQLPLFAILTMVTARLSRGHLVARGMFGP